MKRILFAAFTLFVGVLLTYATIGHQEVSKQATNEEQPDFTTVFKQDEVLKIQVKISKESWDAMQASLDSTVTPHGGMPAMGPPPGGMPPEFGDRPDSAMQAHRPEMHERPQGERPERGPQGMPENQPHGMPGSSVNPDWVECSVSFDGQEWQHVGIRPKGNSSLMAAHDSESKKYSFKLDFDQFEGFYPETKDQRFYGFKQLNLNNNFKDQSLMREKVAADLYREFDVPSAHTAFCALYVDFGDGPQFYGIYTLVEEIDDTVIKTQFSTTKGALYKPDGSAGSFSKGSFDEEMMNLKTHKSTADYSDVKQLYEVLNSGLQEQNPRKWKKQLESVFDVDVFLRWMAARNVMQNWDTYGQIGHNYYLYHNPKNDLLTWIPWDNNEALKGQGNHEGMPGGAQPQMESNESQWPLIDCLLAEPEYKEQYQEYLTQFTNGVFQPDTMAKVYIAYEKMLQPYIAMEAQKAMSIQSETDFENAVDYLKEHVKLRKIWAERYLQSQEFRL